MFPQQHRHASYASHIEAAMILSSCSTRLTPVLVQTHCMVQQPNQTDNNATPSSHTCDSSIGHLCSAAQGLRFRLLRSSLVAAWLPQEMSNIKGRHCQKLEEHLAAALAAAADEAGYRVHSWACTARRRRKLLSRVQQI